MREGAVAHTVQDDLHNRALICRSRSRFVDAGCGKAVGGAFAIDRSACPENRCRRYKPVGYDCDAGVDAARGVGRRTDIRRDSDAGGKSQQFGWNFGRSAIGRRLLCVRRDECGRLFAVGGQHHVEDCGHDQTKAEQQ